MVNTVSENVEVGGDVQMISDGDEMSIDNVQSNQTSQRRSRSGSRTSQIKSSLTVNNKKRRFSEITQSE